MKPTPKMYQFLIGRGYVPYLVVPRPLSTAVRLLYGLPPYRMLGGWLPPRPKVA